MSTISQGNSSMPSSVMALRLDPLTWVGCGENLLSWVFAKWCVFGDCPLEITHLLCWASQGEFIDESSKLMIKLISVDDGSFASWVGGSLVSDLCFGQTCPYMILQVGKWLAFELTLLIFYPSSSSMGKAILVYP